MLIQEAVMEELRLSADQHIKSLKARRKLLEEQVLNVLRTKYDMDINSAYKVVDYYFSEDFLPNWYFYGNLPEEIALHVFIMTQKLDPGTETITQTSEDGKSITYFYNVGKDYPGRIARIITENLEMGIDSYDSVKAHSGISIITLEKKGRRQPSLSNEEKEEIENLKAWVENYCRDQSFRFGDDFLKTISTNYWKEELNSYYPPKRIIRHLDIYERLNRGEACVVKLENTAGDVKEGPDRREKRISIGVMNPSKDFVIKILTAVRDRDVNINRSYFDTFSYQGARDSVGIISFYVNREIKTQDLLPELEEITKASGRAPKEMGENVGLELENIVRTLSDRLSAEDAVSSAIRKLKELAVKNSDVSDSHEYNNFLLNSLTDFLDASKVLGIYEINALLRILIAFDAFDEFFVEAKRGESRLNIPGFRTKHNNARGRAYKGGLRIDPIVEFGEVAALSFMMTWKCARSRILFGGGKGGLMLNRSVYRKNRLDYFDTLTNFGRALFLVTGPSMDVPAGDVGCGAEEVGHMFEGFKSVLRELALIAYGVKQGVTTLGNRVVPLELANALLKNNFDIDPMDQVLLKEIITNEHYLELVAAPQITGKPRMGIATRTGATGRGLRYCLLAGITRRYLEGRWDSSGTVTEGERKLLVKAASITGKTILDADDRPLFTDAEWEYLNQVVFIKLLKDKRVVVQGSGNVGGSVIKELEGYSVNFIAVADAGGAVIGDHLDVKDLISAVLESDNNSVVNAKINVEKVIIGAKEGSMVLGLDCDILVPAALEHAITMENAGLIRAKIVACGSNGPNTAKAERLLSDPARGITVLYDFLANGGGVTASYFEWLRNLAERFRYEAVEIRGEEFDIAVMDPYIMPEFASRIRSILTVQESDTTTREWSLIMRDIMFAALNEDYLNAKKFGVPLRVAGFVDAQLRILSALLLRMSEKDRDKHWSLLPDRTKDLLRPALEHPESGLISGDAKRIVAEFY